MLYNNPFKWEQLYVSEKNAGIILGVNFPPFHLNMFEKFIIEEFTVINYSGADKNFDLVPPNVSQEYCDDSDIHNISEYHR